MSYIHGVGAEEMATTDVVKTLETMPDVPRPPPKAKPFPWVAVVVGVGVALLLFGRKR